MGLIIKLLGANGLLGLVWKLFKLALSIIFFPAKTIFKNSVFIGLVAYVVTIMLLFAFIIRLVEELNINTPWYGNMITFNSLKDIKPGHPYEQENLIQMAMIADYTYSDSYLPYLKKAGYIQIGTRNREGNLVYVLLGKGNTIYIGFRGTDEGADVVDDFLIATTEEAIERFTVAQLIVEKIRTAHPQKEIVIVGHSLGGSAVQYVMWWYSEVKHHCPTNLRAYTFNPFAFPYGDKVLKISPAELLTDVVHEGDIAQAVRQKNRVIGQGILVEGLYNASKGIWLPVDLHNTVGQHSIKGLISNMRAQQGGRYIPPQISKPIHGGEPYIEENSFSSMLQDTL